MLVLSGKSEALEVMRGRADWGNKGYCLDRRQKPGWLLQAHPQSQGSRQTPFLLPILDPRTCSSNLCT